jgi:hypothetical protein
MVWPLFFFTSHLDVHGYVIKNGRIYISSIKIGFFYRLIIINTDDWDLFLQFTNTGLVFHSIKLLKISNVWIREIIGGLTLSCPIVA